MTLTPRLLLMTGAIAAAVAVAAGAFGAHALGDSVSPERLETFETGVRYHLVHALALTLVGWMSRRWLDDAWLRAAGVLFCAGIVFFSGSLYALVLLDAPLFGAVAPLGGLSFIGGWLSLAYVAHRRA